MTHEDLRVAMVVEQCWQRVPGGSARMVLELLAALRAGGADLRPVAAAHRRPAPSPWTVPEPVSHLALPRVPLYEMWTRLRRGRVQRATGPVDVVHATTWAVPPAAGARLVVTVHDLAFRRFPAAFTPRGVAFFERALAVVRAEADAVVCPSEATAADVVHAGIERARVTVVPHGVRVPQPPPGAVAVLRRRLGVDGPYVLWTGTQEPRKNLPVLLRAFERLAGAHPDLALVLVGPFGWGEAAEVPQRLRDRVHLAGFLSEADLHAAYAGAAVMAYPSLWEGFGLPVLEAMAHGTPVVTSRSTATAELVVDGVSGVLVDPGDPDAVAGGIETALERGDQLGAAARRSSRAQTWERAAAATLVAYGAGPAA